MIILTMIHAIDSRPIAEEAIQRLGLQMDPAELLDNLTVEQVENTSFIVLTYESTDPVKATKIVNTVGQVSSELISERSSAFRATVYEKAKVSETPLSPHPLRNGLLTLVIGQVLCAGTVVALPGVGARVAGTLGERPSRQGVGEAGVLGRRNSTPSIVERIKEKELLRALGRRGKLTAVEAAPETLLSVEEANQMLFELAARGHLEVTVEHGKLLYSFWGGARSMKMLLVGALGMLALQVLLVGGLLSMDSLDPILLNPDKELSEDGVSMVMLCGEGHTPEGRGSGVLEKMPPDGDVGAWSRGRTLRGDSCDIWYHHTILYNPQAHEACLIGCDHDWLERRLR